MLSEMALVDLLRVIETENELIPESLSSYMQRGPRRRRRSTQYTPLLSEP